MTTQKRWAQQDEDQDVELPNRLNESLSPYLTAHMNNPVAWQMWTPEALALAKKADKLVFVSIGYSACHWCHAMERESFENQEVASILNESFIPIKVDREERPDVDRIYMNYVQATTGGGGWPLNVFLTPGLQPLFGGTYWPGPDTTLQADGQVSFLDILSKMRDVWQDQRRRCLESAKEITNQLRQFTQEGLISHHDRQEGQLGVDALDLDLLEEAYEHFLAKFDPKFGGFGYAPKFPTPVNLRFMLRLGQGPAEARDVVGHHECKNAEDMVLRTLKAMWRGGIKDQIGHGFARYSATRDWNLPHFEKMLYDQAQLLSTYLDAYLITKDLEFLDAIHDISRYLTSTPILSSGGGFYSSEYADSYYRATDKEKREGAYYVWTAREFYEVLDRGDAEIAMRYYNVEKNGNVSAEHSVGDEFIDQNVLAVSRDPTSLAEELGLPEETVVSTLKSVRRKLLEHRETERERPLLDDKIIVAWNGLALGALARVSAAIEATDVENAKVYLGCAIQAATFIRNTLYDEASNTLKRIHCKGQNYTPAFADDYAFLIAGLLDLYESTWDDSWLMWADTLQKKQIELFHDPVAGAFFSTADGEVDLILRLKDGMDNAEPSTNGVAASNLSRLASMLEDGSYASLAKETVQAFEAEIMQHPFLFTSLLDSVVYTRLGDKGVIVTGDGAEVKQAVEIVRSTVNSFRTVVKIGGGAKFAWLRVRNRTIGTMDAAKPGIQVCDRGVRRLLEGAEIVKAVI